MVIDTIIAAVVPTLVILAAFWKLSGRLSYQDAMLTALRERVQRIEAKLDSDGNIKRRRLK
jgi:hypothetical protein